MPRIAPTSADVGHHDPGHARRPVMSGSFWRCYLLNTVSGPTLFFP